MRRAFLSQLVKLAESDERILLLTGDLGFSVIEPFRERFPTRFFNVGVAEQNLIGIATGLAHGGFIPYVYSIATFAALRPYEFIRNGPVLHHLPVRIIAVGGGFDYGAAGPTHHCLEDLALMRALPGLTVISPCDPLQAASALAQTHSLPGPIYFRLGKNDYGEIPELGGSFELSRPAPLRTGKEVALLTTGAISSEVIGAAHLLSEGGLSPSVFLVSTLQPFDSSLLLQPLREVSRAYTVEAHQINGGLGSLIAEVIAEHGLTCRLTRLGVNSPPRTETGSQSFLEAQHSLSARQIFERIQRDLSGV